jgi:hypothetical protein
VLFVEAHVPVAWFIFVEAHVPVALSAPQKCDETSLQNYPKTIYRDAFSFIIRHTVHRCDQRDRRRSILLRCAHKVRLPTKTPKQGYFVYIAETHISRRTQQGPLFAPAEQPRRPRYSKSTLRRSARPRRLICFSEIRRDIAPMTLPTIPKQFIALLSALSASMHLIKLRCFFFLGVIYQLLNE